MKFSVLLPTRNGAKYLKICIQSILNQTYDDMELCMSGRDSFAAVAFEAVDPDIQAASKAMAANVYHQM